MTTVSVPFNLTAWMGAQVDWNFYLSFKTSNQWSQKMAPNDHDCSSYTTVLEYGHPLQFPSHCVSNQTNQDPRGFLELDPLWRNFPWRFTPRNIGCEDRGAFWCGAGSFIFFVLKLCRTIKWKIDLDQTNKHYQLHKEDLDNPLLWPGAEK